MPVFDCSGGHCASRCDVAASVRNGFAFHLGILAAMAKAVQP